MFTTEPQRAQREMFFIRSGDDDRIKIVHPSENEIIGLILGLATGKNLYFEKTESFLFGGYLPVK
jgi:hypothetical protein